MDAEAAGSSVGLAAESHDLLVTELVLRRLWLSNRCHSDVDFCSGLLCNGSEMLIGLLEILASSRAHFHLAEISHCSGLGLIFFSRELIELRDRDGSIVVVVRWLVLLNGQIRLFGCGRRGRGRIVCGWGGRPEHGGGVVVDPFSTLWGV